MKRLQYILLTMLLAFIGQLTQAQAMNAKAEEPTDLMHANGKIFVVMAVVVVIVLGLFLYLINLDRKIGKLERKEGK